LFVCLFVLFVCLFVACRCAGPLRGTAAFFLGAMGRMEAG
jgi:hypothetical protein